MDPEDKDRERLRAMFGEAPALYDRARPSYPAAMFDDLAALAGLTAGSRVLEIGAGTGQATLALAERGYDVTAVEFSGGMAAIAATYTIATYLDLLRTYSGHRALPDPARTGLLDCIANLIDTCHDGEIAKRYLTQLHLAHART